MQAGHRLLGHIGVLTLAASLAAGCSVTRAEVLECTSNQQCRASFGLGAVCSQSGSCETLEPPRRCDASHPESLLDAPGEHGESVVFATLMDRSLQTQLARQNAARLAAVQVNEAGGIDGRVLGFIFCDIAEDADADGLDRTEAAIEIATALTGGLGLPALLGPSASSDALEVFRATEPTGTVIISPSATSPALTTAEPDARDGSPGRLWRTAPPDSLQAQAIAWDMQQRQIAAVAVVSQAGAYGDDLARLFSDHFEGSVEGWSFSTTGERSEVIVDAGSSAAQEVLFISSATQDVIAFLDSAASLSSYASKTLFLSDSAANQDVLDRASPNLFAQVRGTRPAPLSATEERVYANFIAAYQSEYREDAARFSFTAHAYDAAWLLFYGAAWSMGQRGAVDSAGIALGLQQVSNGEQLELKTTSWSSVVDAFARGDGIDSIGASGSPDFHGVTEEVSAPIQIWSIATEAGEPALVEEAVFATR